MPSTTPAQPDRTEAYAARTTSGRLVIAHLGPDPISPLHRALRAARLNPDRNLTVPTGSLNLLPQPSKSVMLAESATHGP